MHLKRSKQMHEFVSELLLLQPSIYLPFAFQSISNPTRPLLWIIHTLHFLWSESLSAQFLGS